jgi:hypothetical protein
VGRKEGEVMTAYKKGKTATRSARALARLVEIKNQADIKNGLDMPRL